MKMKTGLTFACLNLKKLAKMKDRLGLLGGPDGPFRRMNQLKTILA